MVSLSLGAVVFYSIQVYSIVSLQICHCSCRCVEHTRMQYYRHILQFKLILYITPSRPGESAEHSQLEEDSSPTNKESQNTVQEQNEKRLRGLKKKIQQIEKLKIKQEEGEALEDSQVIYIKTKQKK